MGKKDKQQQQPSSSLKLFACLWYIGKKRFYLWAACLSYRCWLRFFFCFFKLCLPFMWLAGWLAWWYILRLCDGTPCVCVFIFHNIRFCVRVPVFDVVFSSLFPYSSWWLFFNAVCTAQHSTTHFGSNILSCCVVLLLFIFYVLSFTLSISAVLAKVEQNVATIQVESTPVGITIAHLECTIQSFYIQFYAMLYHV